MGANLILPSSSPADDAAVVTKSCRWNYSDDNCLTRTFSSGGDRRLWTWSGWVKRGKMGSIDTYGLGIFGAGNDPMANLSFHSDDTLMFDVDITGSDYTVATSAVFRDPAAWYHIVLVYDSDQTTDTDRVKIYVNNVQYTLTSSSLGWIPQYYDSPVNDEVVHHIGAYNSTWSTNFYDGYMADIYFIDGEAKAPSDFAAADSNGQWSPIAYAGGYGTTGFHLDFNDSADLGNDAAGSNNFTPSVGFAASDQMNDRPTNNYATLNPLANRSASTLSEGDLKVVAVGANSASLDATINLPSSLKWYWESHQDGVVGIEEGITYEGKEIAISGIGVYSTNVYALGSAVVTGISRSADDILQFAVDSATGKVWVGKNNTWWAADGGTDGDPSAGTNQTATITTPAIDEWVASLWDVTSSATRIYNFGQDPTFGGNKSGEATSEFFYTPPTGFLALSTANLPDPDIKKGHKNFNTLLYDDGTGAKTFGAADNMQPDLVWVKARGSVQDHKLFDSVRGVQVNLIPNETTAEGTDSSLVGVTVFGEDGFTIGSNSSTSGPYANTDSPGMVGWGWKGGTAGSGGSGVDWAENYNKPAGFSIVKWTGNDSSYMDASQTVSHSLEATPDFIIAKNRTNVSMGAQDWIVYHKDLTSDYFLRLNTTGAQFDGAQGSSAEALINTIGVNSVAFASDTSSTMETLNYDAETYIAYLFSEVEGYSKFGSYVGNNDVNGPFVWCGFRPTWILFKSYTTGGGATYEWTLIDTARSAYNIERAALSPDNSNAEDTDDIGDVDILSNGFKLRGTQNNTNGSNTYIFAAFAEKPFKYAAAR